MFKKYDVIFVAGFHHLVQGSKQTCLVSEYAEIELISALEALEIIKI